eukprot:TRINITY_DN730_c0_g2_i2.p1 TRINITY_DN730_c0_g2~~TRINITY_DN730_c0_g2_i2.p1  ORF type:complete len:274 (+),score=29.92 TRINITY_DN730_c0_g2_i2:200-1021(+)
MISHEAPVLSCCWTDDGTKVFSSGCDNKALCWDLASSKTQHVATHDKPIKYVNWISQNKILMTGSWDSTIRYWDGRAPTVPVLSVNLPNRLYSADVRDHYAIAATAERHIVLYDLRQPKDPFLTKLSPMKFQTRCIKLFTDNKGFAVGSIDGRVSINYISDRDARQNFLYRCHRSSDEVYAVNDITFNTHGTYATCGSDGYFHFWDKNTRDKMYSSQKCVMPVNCGSFNMDSTLFAYASSYDWSKGVTGFDSNVRPQISIFRCENYVISNRRR